MAGGAPTEQKLVSVFPTGLGTPFAPGPIFTRFFCNQCLGRLVDAWYEPMLTDNRSVHRKSLLI